MKCWLKAARFAPLLTFIFAVILPSAVQAQGAADVTASAAIQTGSVPIGVWAMFAVAGVCAGALAAFLICCVLQKPDAQKMQNPSNATGDKAYFVYRYRNTIHDGVRPLYFVFYFGFDVRQTDSTGGNVEAESILHFASGTLAESVSSSDFFARIDDGFIVACRSVSHEKAEDWTSQVLIRLNGYGEKYDKGCAPVFRAGIYHLSKGDTDVESVLLAVQGGYRQAVERPAPFCLIDESALSASREKEELRRRSIKAIAEHEFTCFLQYIVCSETGEVYGAEVLSRWMHPQRGLLMPKMYISDMEYNETIIEMDFYMLEETCRLLELFSDMGWQSYRLFCNVSRKTFSLPDFVARVLAIADRYRFAHENLCLEITESMMFDNHKTAGDNARSCRAEGFGIALDDVGCGFSSFGDLANCPWDIAKIDRSLLLGATQENGRRLLNGLNELFHNLQVRTLCEGVETQEQQELVRSLGIDYIQGYLIQKPLSVQDAVQWLRETRKAQS